jgi:hypothetical protein
MERDADTIMALWIRLETWLQILNKLIPSEGPAWSSLGVMAGRKLGLWMRQACSEVVVAVFENSVLDLFTT